MAGENLDNKYVSYFDGPTGILYAKDTLFIADQWNNRIVIIPDKDKYLSSIDIEQIKGEILVFLDNNEISFPDTLPLIIDQKVSVPIRSVAEAWGAEVIWNQEKKMVSLIKNNKTIDLSLEEGDFFTYKVRSMVSMEILKENLGLDVEWLDKYNIISIQSK